MQISLVLCPAALRREAKLEGAGRVGLDLPLVGLSERREIRRLRAMSLKTEVSQGRESDG